MGLYDDTIYSLIRRNARTLGNRTAWPAAFGSPGYALEIEFPLLARFKKPKIVVFVSELPKTTDGRVDRIKVKEMYGTAP